MKADRKGLTGNGWIRLAAVLLLVLLIPGSPAASGSEPSAWQSLQEAILRAEGGGVIMLSEDVTASAEDLAISIDSGRCVTLDLNGHTLNRTPLKGGAGKIRKLA